MPAKNEIPSGGNGREGCHKKRQILVTIIIKDKRGLIASQQDHAITGFPVRKSWNPGCH
ncbi:hypothetical protein KKF34_07350 [Myxococcota bacterium]|nr:hypothetical protein [Myxococcota bacterium]MBU1382869.1 hypothetical protein [Myxococcota bacterium]MBU1496675.1 hypothetical protein [Myxococcota bacterium]